MHFLLVLIILLVAIHFYRKSRKTERPPIVIQPPQKEMGITINVTKGQGGLPVITIRTDVGGFNVEAVKQDSDGYIVSAAKHGDNEIVITVENQIIPQDS